MNIFFFETETGGLNKLKIMYYKKPKILPGYGGVTNVAENLTKALAKKVSITYYPNFESKSDYLTSLLKIFRSLTISDYDVVHLNRTPSWLEGAYGLLKLAKLSGASTLLNIHGIIQLEYSLYGRKKNKWPWLTSDNGLLKTLRACKLVDKLVTYSEFMRNRIIKYYGINRDKIAMIPNGVNVEKFSEFKNKLILDGDPVVLYLGHLSKGVDLLIKTISSVGLDLPELKLHIVGGGRDITDFKLLASKKGIETRIVFHGTVPYAMTPDYYKAADFFIFPSVNTPAGITILEAMASGTPVIASNIGGASEIIHHCDNGVLFDPNNPVTFSNAIIALTEDPNLRKSISQNAFKAVKEYSWEKIARKYLSLYQNLIEEHSRT